MPQCVEISGGVVVESAETFPACSEFAIVEPGHLDRLTYWADLSIALDPAEPEVWLLMTGTLVLFAVAKGWNLIIRQIFNR